MNVLIVSQCSKKALTETRRILDQFAERKGERTWQTAITQQGLLTLRKLLRQSAKRNTAVACHWLKSANQTELLWIVGNLKEFNPQGIVPTNSTRRDILRTQDESQWHTAESISLLAGIAGLFHDFGKANKLFQAKLQPKAKLRSEPYRHEWVSLRLFQAFVGQQTDQQWLESLKNVDLAAEASMLAGLIKDSPSSSPNPFKALPPLACAVGWLIVSHHRLPKFNPPDQADKAGNQPRIDEIDTWMKGKRFTPAWNSPQCDYADWQAKDWQQVWQFEHGTPMRSATWRKKAHSLAKRALQHASLCGRDWLQDAFSSHIARLTLMLADHCYSAGAANPKWQDAAYQAYANTDPKTRSVKQKLDEHNVGVGHNALLLAKSLPRLRHSLPAITRHKGFKQRSKDERFRWQDKAYDLAQGVAKRSQTQGFFGVNMASTGCGKTFANARVMYGLADEKLGCRFSVALGLRTLTLQTGDALRERLHLESDDLAVLIGSQSVRQLHELQKDQAAGQHQPDTPQRAAEQTGSESAEAMFDEFQYLHYDGSLDDGRLSQWLAVSPKLQQLLSAPVLVSTIDHLMPATEGERGGKQIAPMLRLLTSDLILDEPDDFDLADLPALSRLVNWAGMLGARVLLSSATLPPALVKGLFDAYAAGRRCFNAACTESGAASKASANVAATVCCAWFDEFGAKQSDHADLASFTSAHEQFVAKRIKNLAEQQQTLRQAQLLAVEPIPKSAAKTPFPTPQEVVAAMAGTIHDAIHRLHRAHHQVHAPSGKRVSIGLVRMANIKPMVALAQALLAQAAQTNHRIHFCIYHSQHPLLVRSKMEQELDAALTRHQPEKLWQVAAIKAALAGQPEQNHVFVVFATAVAEVGRDHDYDWAIAEPSSMRSLIQLAGRIQRHRQQAPDSPNLLILSKNYKALRGETLAYCQPGFESSVFPLKSKDLGEILQLAQYQYISAAPRIQARDKLDASGNLVDLEHAHLAAKIFGGKDMPIAAALWWRHQAHWCYELQRKTPFRLSGKDEEFVLYLEDELDEPLFHEVAESGELALVEQGRFARIKFQADFDLGTGVEAWLANDVKSLLVEIAEVKEMELAQASKRFAQLRLRETEKRWAYHPWFGVHGALDL
jgi:CRISPR-associated endonuclease/helicase Cas3